MLSLGLYLSRSVMFLLKTVLLLETGHVVATEVFKMAMGCCWIDEDGEMDNEELDEQDEELETDDRVCDD